MLQVLWLAALAALIAGLLTNILIPSAARLALAVRAVDHPGGRKIQPGSVPRLGGLAIVSGLALAAVGVALTQWRTLGAGVARSELLTLLLSTAMIFLVGVVDDLFGLSSFKKFMVQLAAAVLLVNVGWSFSILSLPGGNILELGVFGPILSVLWLVGVTNAINLLDGLDGLAGGVVAIIATSLLCYALLLGDTAAVILMSATAGACLGFLRHNWSPATIFMGDSGSLTLGFLLAATSIRSALKAPATVAILVPLLALGLPVIDTLLVMLVRFLARPKGALTARFLQMFRADRKHLHHLLLHQDAKSKRVVGWMYAAVLGFCLLALTVALTQNPLLGGLLLALEAAVIFAMRRLGMRAEADRISQHRKEELESAFFGDDEDAGGAPSGTGESSGFARG